MHNPETPAAASAWFTFTTEGETGFGVYAFDGVEEAHEPYSFLVDLVHRSPAVNLNGLCGKRACLSITDRSGGARHVHGLIKSLRQLRTGGGFTHYACELAPRLAFLDMVRDQRIFQQLSVVEIIRRILREQGFTDEEYEFALAEQYPPREYCVQYGESSLHFISRLCEEEGIFYYFAHSADNHRVCFADREGGRLMEGESSVRCHSGNGQRPDTAVVNSLAFRTRVNSNAATYTDWNFARPRLDLTVTATEQDPAAAPVPEGMRLERYAHPHIHSLRDPGDRYARLQLARQTVFSSWIEAGSDIARFLPGFAFSLEGHPRAECNASWLAVRVGHHGEQPAVLEETTPDGRGFTYASTVAAIPASRRFVPECRHLKQKVPGRQTALVSGPEGEEIHVDRHGRVKVRFHWDREGQGGGNASCWLRVSRSWAGNGHGALAIPRIGQEVIVGFMEGDPDRPVVTGRVYNARALPPYALPRNKTRTVFRSQSTPGRSGKKKRGFNELSFEDKAGRERFFVHAEKDAHFFVKNDWGERIRNERHSTVRHDSFSLVKGEDHHRAAADRKVEVHKDDHLHVRGDSHLRVSGRRLLKAGQEAHYLGERIVVEAAVELTLKAGDSFLRLNPAGVLAEGRRVDFAAGSLPPPAKAFPALDAAPPEETLPTATPALPWRGRDDPGKP
ncbi:MAG: type VI secretion system tip protein VgrG [Deltaproteobacteria bacterium]|nr:type VI secretion system tip protein VgrG [Deltaproteobacteria bacterium]